VHWHEWGEEAFATAQRENKPILLDIGAVWCHWCHVMDRESYDDPEIAQIVNDRFIAVKVDRDERPDIDSRYQAAVSAISGQGGWPLTAFLTPDGRPFYGGTYFPPSDQYGRPSFKRVLLAISDAYHEKNGEVVEQAKMVESALSQSESFAGRSGEFSAGVIDAIVKSVLGMFDPGNGGFGSAPKFPHPAALDLLIDQYARSGDEHLRNVFVTTLEKMARGGVYDQLAGGFHRYSVDERWVVPHFEKMCYDNSELLKNYVHAYQATGSEFFASVARDIIRWMDEWLSDRERGGFYASQDADYSMDDDGDYFTWTLEETRAVLTEEEANVASLHYDIHEIGEMHHNPAKNVLYVRASVEEIAKRLSMPSAGVETLLQSAKEKMYAARLKRPTPYVDKTVYVGWNAMCVSAYLQAARALELDAAQHFALRSLDRIRPPSPDRLQACSTIMLLLQWLAWTRTRPLPTSATSISRVALPIPWWIVFSIQTLEAFLTPRSLRTENKSSLASWERDGSHSRIRRLLPAILSLPSCCSGFMVTPTSKAIVTKQSRLWKSWPDWPGSMEFLPPRMELPRSMYRRRIPKS